METIEEALKRVKEIHGDRYYYLAIEGECPDLRELEPYQRVCYLGIEGYYCLLEDKAKDAEDNLGVILDNKHEVESTSSDWQTTNGEPLERMFGLITEEEQKIIDIIEKHIHDGYAKNPIDFNWEKIAAGKIYSSIKEKIWISEELENNIYGIYDYIKNIRYDLEEKGLLTSENSRLMDIHVTEQWAKEAKEIIDTKKIDSNEKAVVLVNKFYNEFYLKRNNEFNNETKQMTIDESKNYWIKQNID